MIVNSARRSSNRVLFSTAATFAIMAAGFTVSSPAAADQEKASGAAAATTAAPPTPAAKPAPKPPVTAKQPAPPALPPVVKLPANVVARVGGQNITRDELLAFVDMTHGGQYVEQLVNNALLKQEAKRLGVTVTKEELDARIRTLKDQIVQNQFNNGRTPMTFQQIAEREGFSNDLLRWSAYTEILRRKTLEKSLASQIPTMEDQRKLAHILFATLPGNNAQIGQPGAVQQPSAADQAKKDADAKKRLEALLADLKAGKITWEEAARQSDDKANSDKGGALGFVARPQLDGDFVKAAWAIPKSGDIAGPIKTPFGYHLIKLEQKGSEATAAEKAAYRKQMVDQQMNNPEVLASWLRDLRSKSKVERNPSPVLVPGAKSPASVANNLKSGGAPSSKPASKPAPAKTSVKPSR